MDSSLLNKEKHYRKVNNDLKFRTSKLLKEMECSIDENFKELSNSNFVDTDDCCPLMSSSSKSGNIGNEGLIRVLQAKVKVLSEQLSTLQSDYVKRTEEWKSLQVDIVKVEENMLKNKQCLLSTHDKLKKQEKLLTTVTSHLQVRDRENNILRKQIESLKRELSQHESNSSANEVRLNRSLEDIDRLKEALKKCQLEEKTLKDINKGKQEDFNKIISRLEKQKMELTSSFKKQLYLINNLKKQQGILETSTLISLTEEEFIKLLDWSPGFS